MRSPLQLAQRAFFGVLAALGFGYFNTSTVLAENCAFQCGGCAIWYVACDSCSGSGCDTVGLNCDGACWNCYDGSQGCAS